MTKKTTAQKRKEFRELHSAEPFLIPNAHDAGSAARLEQLGFSAIASTSAGFASTIAENDLTVSRDETLAYLEKLVAATELPVNADFESGFAVEAEDVAENVKLALDTGISGLSIEDRNGDQLFDSALSVARIQAARKAIDSVDENIILVGRCENYLIGNDNLDDIINRLAAYADAGADVLYAPGLSGEENIKAVVSAVAPKPVNVLIVSPETKAEELFGLGVKRVSVGGFLANAGWNHFDTVAKQLLSEGSLPSNAFA